MRISMEQDDAGYTTLASFFAVLVDGRKMMDVVSADEEKGWVKHYVRKDGRMLNLDREPIADDDTTSQPLMAETFGHVELLLKPHGNLLLRPNSDRTEAWLRACGKQQGNLVHMSVQVGVHLEEMIEFVEELDFHASQGWDRYGKLAYLSDLAHEFKSGARLASFKNPANALKELCDIKVTADGVAFLAGWSMLQADQAVLANNESKLNPDGTAVILEGGKIGKAPGYKKVDLTSFV